MSEGVLKAISGETYGIFSKKKVLYEFRVKNIKKRRKIDILQGQKVNFKKDIAPLLK